MLLRGTNFCTSSARFAPSFVRQPNGPGCTQMVLNAAKRQLRAKSGGLGAFVAKILTQLCGTNFCASSACFAPSFVRQPNGPECTQMVRNAPKCHFRVKWGGSALFVAKNLTRLRGTNFSTSSAHFAPSFLRQPNGPECTQIVQNAPKCLFRVERGGSGAFFAKNSEATSWHELLLYFGPFCTEFRKATKRSRSTQILWNAPKRQFRVQLGGSGAFVAKNSDATSWHELLH